MLACPEPLADIFGESSDIRPRRTRDTNFDLLFITANIRFENFKFVNLRVKWFTFDRLTFSSEFIKLFSADFFRRKHRRHLSDPAAKFRKHPLDILDGDLRSFVFAERVP